MVRNMTIIAMITPTMVTDTFTLSRTRRMDISANWRSAISVSTRSLRSSQAVLPSLLALSGPTHAVASIADSAREPASARAVGPLPADMDGSRPVLHTLARAGPCFTPRSQPGRADGSATKRVLVNDNRIFRYGIARPTTRNNNRGIYA